MPLQHRARRSPPRAGPFPAPPRRAAATRTATHAAELASTCSRSPCLLLNLKYVPELPTDSLLHSRMPILHLLLLPVRDALPELRRSSCSPSTAASAASHPRSSASVAPPPPTDAHRPAQFCSPALDRPDHRAGELELRRRSVSSPSRCLIVSQPRPSIPSAPHHHEEAS
jgi:hypothetical protein